MRITRHCLWLPVLLVFAVGTLAAQTVPGYLAQGSVALTTAHGQRSGTITVEAAAGGRCKVTIALSSALALPARPQQITAVYDGTRAVVAGPARLLHSAPLAIGPRLGCSLLAPRVAGPSASLTLVAGSAHLATLAWRQSGRSLELQYAYSSAAAALPSTVTEIVDGTARLVVRYRTIAAQTFAVSDFNPSPHPGTRPAVAGRGR